MGTSVSPCPPASRKGWTPWPHCTRAEGPTTKHGATGENDHIELVAKSQQVSQPNAGELTTRLDVRALERHLVSRQAIVSACGAIMPSD